MNSVWNEMSNEYRCYQSCSLAQKWMLMPITHVSWLNSHRTLSTAEKNVLHDKICTLWLSQKLVQRIQGHCVLCVVVLQRIYGNTLDMIYKVAVCHWITAKWVHTRLRCTFRTYFHELITGRRHFTWTNRCSTKDVADLKIYNQESYKPGGVRQWTLIVGVWATAQFDWIHVCYSPGWTILGFIHLKWFFSMNNLLWYKRVRNLSVFICILELWNKVKCIKQEERWVSSFLKSEKVYWWSYRNVCLFSNHQIEI